MVAKSNKPIPITFFFFAISYTGGNLFYGSMIMVQQQH